MTAVTIKGLEELRAKLTAFSDRRFESAIAEALNNTGKQITQEWAKQLSAKLDRPTVLTQRAAILTKRANVGTLSTIVAMRDSIPNDGIPPSEYLLTHELGTGDRALKKFERALVASGAMPPGHKCVPGKYAQLDSHGNVSRGQIVQVLNQLGAALTEGYQRVISRDKTKREVSAKKRGRLYMPVPYRIGKIEAGIYEMKGKEMRVVFFFVKGTRYRKGLSLMDEGEKVAQKVMNIEMNRAIQKRIDSLAKRNAGG